MKLSFDLLTVYLATGLLQSQAKDTTPPLQFLRTPKPRHKRQARWQGNPPKKFQRRAVSSHANNNDTKHRNLNIAYQFIVNGKKTSGGKEWCMEATNGLDTGKSMQYRPCKIKEASYIQLWDWYGQSEGKIRHYFEADKCLVVEDGEGTVEEGDRIRIGSCDLPRAEFVYGHGINGGNGGRIKVKSNTNLCLSFEGNNPDDNDRIVVKDCEGDNSNAVNWVFRTGWYEIYGGDECMVVRAGNISSGNRAIWDKCSDVDSDERHWRIDEDGLFHIRKNEDYCLEAEEEVEGSPIRIQPCDNNNSRQVWDWGNFEAPINLVGTSLYIGIQGNTDNEGDPMVLESEEKEWSGDGVLRV